MPISPENAKLYPPDWKAIRADVLKRASDCCEECHVPNYAVGYRDEDGEFVRAGGNQMFDAAGNGELSYAEARALADHANEWQDPDEHFIVIVLTIAHLDHVVVNCALENLRALCQRCHLRHDITQHQRNAAATRRAAKQNGELFA